VSPFSTCQDFLLQGGENFLICPQVRQLPFRLASAVFSKSKPALKPAFKSQNAQIVVLVFNGEPGLFLPFKGWNVNTFVVENPLI
jgi:hypothetical protein